MLVVSLRIFFLIVLLSMLAVNGWAVTHESLLQIPARVTGDPWFIATLFDAYFGFLTFYMWVLSVTHSIWRRGVWLIAILLAGNIAMASFMLIRLFKLPTTAGWRDIWCDVGIKL